jgi:2'-hydroxyisoflavone reductase
VRVLVIGGTGFLGRHLVPALRAHGHAVTLFNRGLAIRAHATAAPFAEVAQLHGDRDGGLQPLRMRVEAAAPGRAFDAVVDTCGYLPRVVAQSCALLREACARYVFISSISAYADGTPPGAREEAPLAPLADPATEDVAAHYGALKAACEHEVRRAFGDRAVVVRPGLIVGPFDPTGRFTYWPRRLAEGGAVLAPGPADAPLQFIDARDLADWLAALVSTEARGTFHAAGPALPLTFGGFLAACQHAIGVPARLHWVDAAWLINAGVVPWTGLPLWLGGEADGLMQLDCGRAHAAGLVLRPLEQTIVDTLAWVRGPAFTPPPARHAGVGLSALREAELLARSTAG